MRFQADPESICWRLHLCSPLTAVYQMLATDVRRASFGAESAKAQDGVIHFVFPNNVTWDAAILQAIPPHSYAVHDYRNSVAAFTLTDDGQGGTDLTLTDSGVPARPLLISASIRACMSRIGTGTVAMLRIDG